uniref:BTB domain-containing protein n=1 Tax=Panagrellus redivivus TaxID=6233 RepID=A0A7E4VSM8_PANRE
MPSADDKATNLRRSDRQRKPSKRATSPYEAVRYTEPKKKPGPKPKKPRQSSVKSEPRNGSVEDEMPESELTGFLNDNKQPAARAPAPKSPKIVPNHASTSQNSQNEDDDDIQIIGVKPPATPMMVTVPLPVEVRQNNRSEYSGVVDQVREVEKTRMVRFRNCSTDKPEIHIQSADFPDYDHVYIAENKRWTNSIRFYCAKEFDRMLFAEMVILADGSFQLFEYGKHRNSCCVRSKGFEEETVQFLDNMLFVKVPETQKCTLSEDQSHLTVHHPRGDFAFVFFRNLPNDEAEYKAECGCQAQAILTETAVWANYYHTSECPLRPQTRAEPSSRIGTYSGNNHRQPSPASVATVVIPEPASTGPASETTVVSTLIELTLPSDPENSAWLSSFTRYHEFPVDGDIAYQYWNRVDISKSVSMWQPVVCDLGVLDTSALVAHLLLGSTANARQLQCYFKNRFSEYYPLLKVFEKIDYRQLEPLAPIIVSVMRFEGYCMPLLEFVARYLDFRILAIKNGAEFRRYGNWFGSPTPVATVNCVRNGKYEIVTGMHGIFK